MIWAQIFDIVNIGIVILDENINVIQWNRWMETYSRIRSEKIIGSSLFEFFPKLENRLFLRNFKSVLRFGNFVFFSQKLHNYLFPFKCLSPFDSTFEYMQQSCTMAPLRDDNKQIRYVFIMVQDVTDVAVYQQKLIEMNNKDGLTGVFNRRYIQSRLQEELQRYKRYSRPFSLIIQDIDYFKKVNDTYGHQAGDFILKSFASSVVSSMRKTDIFARYGGEEFCCLLPETPIESGLIFAEKLRTRIMETDFDFNGTMIRITISQGITEVCNNTDSVESLLKEADTALYKAKNTGRNKVVPALIDGAF